MKPSMLRVRLEAVIAVFAGALGILTIFWRDWIESLTGWDPDHHNGSAEWLVVAVLLAVAAVMGTVSRRHWKLRQAAAAAATQ
jgi:hypothetical protein